MRMGMPQRLVQMGMAVSAGRHDLMGVVVVPVVMAVRVFMLEALVRMLVTMGLHQVQHHAEHHQRASGRHHPGAASIAESNGKGRVDERREGKPTAAAPA